MAGLMLQGTGSDADESVLVDGPSCAFVNRKLDGLIALARERKP
jgi:hypothetical protein